MAAVGGPLLPPHAPQPAGRGRLLAQYHRHVRPHNRHEPAHYHFLAGCLAAQQGEREEALVHAATACEHLRPLHSPHFELLVRRLIQWNDLAMPENTHLLAAWPMAVRIHTLGRFAIQVQGCHLPRQPAHNKPLKLLQALIALGGREVADYRIGHALWPVADGNAAHRALITNLQHLRKLLGVRDAIRYHHGRLTLDPRRCWVDAWAFEREPDGHESQTLALYRGAFQRDEGDDDWLLPLRERLHALALRRYRALLEGLATEGRWSELVAHGHRVLGLDPLHEPLYQALIRAHHQLGHRGEVLPYLAPVPPAAA